MPFNYYRHEEFPEFITVREFSGIVKPEDIIGSWKEMQKQGMLDEPTVGLLNILNETDIQMGLTGLKDVLQFMVMNKYARRLRIAAVSTNPSLVAFPFLATKLQHALEIRPFASKRAAVAWLLAKVETD